MSQAMTQKQEPSADAMKAARMLYRDLAWDTDEPEGMTEVARALDAFAARAVEAEREAIDNEVRDLMDNHAQHSAAYMYLETVLKLIAARGKGGGR